jgi:hypothetical protein
MQLTCLAWLQHRRLALADDVLRAAHRCGRIERHDLARHQPVEQMADRGEGLLDGGSGYLIRLDLDPGGDMQGLRGRNRRHAGSLAPGQEIGDGAGIGAARVRVADLSGEKFEEADAGAVAGGGDQGREEG